MKKKKSILMESATLWSYLDHSKSQLGQILKSMAAFILFSHWATEYPFLLIFRHLFALHTLTPTGFAASFVSVVSQACYVLGHPWLPRASDELFLHCTECHALSVSIHRSNLPPLWSHSSGLSPCSCSTLSELLLSDLPHSVLYCHDFYVCLFS